MIEVNKRISIERAIKLLEKKFAPIRSEIKNREQYPKPSECKRAKWKRAADKRKKYELRSKERYRQVGAAKILKRPRTQ